MTFRAVREEIFAPGLVASPFDEADDTLLAEANNFTMVWPSAYGVRILGYKPSGGAFSLGLETKAITTRLS